MAPPARPGRANLPLPGACTLRGPCRSAACTWVAMPGPWQPGADLQGGQRAQLPGGLAVQGSRQHLGAGGAAGGPGAARAARGQPGRRGVLCADARGRRLCRRPGGAVDQLPAAAPVRPARPAPAGRARLPGCAQRHPSSLGACFSPPSSLRPPPAARTWLRSRPAHRSRLSPAPSSMGRCGRARRCSRAPAQAAARLPSRLRACPAARPPNLSRACPAGAA